MKPKYFDQPVSTPQEARVAILKAEYDTPIVHTALMTTRHLGWSGEDLYSIIAWHALQRAEDLESRLLERIRKTPFSLGVVA